MGLMDVAKIAKLANIPITKTEEHELTNGFEKVLKVLDLLAKVNVKNIEPVSQVTGLTDVTREDEIDVTRIFSQEQALGNAKHSENGYFVVDKVLDET